MRLFRVNQDNNIITIDYINVITNIICIITHCNREKSILVFQNLKYIIILNELINVGKAMRYL